MREILKIYILLYPRFVTMILAHYSHNNIEFTGGYRCRNEAELHFLDKQVGLVMKIFIKNVHMYIMFL